MLIALWNEQKIKQYFSINNVYTYSYECTPPFRAADAVTRVLVAVRLVLGTAEVDVVVPVTVLPVAEVAAGRGAELPVALRENKEEKVIVSSLKKE